MTKSKNSDPHPQAVLTNANVEAAHSGLLQIATDIGTGTHHRAPIEEDGSVLNFADRAPIRSFASSEDDGFIRTQKFTQPVRLNSENDEQASIISTRETTARHAPAMASLSKGHGFIENLLSELHAGSASVTQQRPGLFRVSSVKPGPEDIGSITAKPNPNTPNDPMITAAQIASLKSGIDTILDPIEQALGLQVFADQLPLVGDNLKDAFDNAADALHFVQRLEDTIVAGLQSINDGNDRTRTQVQDAINAALHSAAGGFPANTSVTVVYNSATDIKLNFVTTHSYSPLTMPLDASLDLPGLGFSLNAPKDAQTVFGYTFNFTAGIDGTGFYLDTAPADTLFQIDATTTVPGLTANANLGPLRFNVNDLTGADATKFTAGFGITLKDNPNSNDGHLHLNELGGDALDATLTGNAAVGLHLASDLGTAALPDIGADLKFNWGFNSATVDPSLGNANFGNIPTVDFDNISLGLGSFFSDFIAPIFSEVQIVTEPLQPIVDALLKPIGFLSKIGVTLSLLDIAKLTGEVDPETADRLKLYGTLVSFINAIPDGGDVRIDLGNYSIGTADPRATGFLLADATPQLLGTLVPPGDQSDVLKEFLKSKNDLPGGGLAFPLIENPTTAINLLFGKSVDFFHYQVPGLDIDRQGIDLFYSLFGPLGVRFVATVEAHLHVTLGYDSSGITQFAQTGDPEDIFNGFYVVDPEGPMGTLTARLQAFAAFNVVFAEAGVGGGLVGNLNGSLNDADATPGDGRIHLAQLNSAQLCDLFSLSGDVTAGLSAYLTIGLGPFSETFEKDFGHEVIVSFDAGGCDAAGMPGVPVFAHKTGPTLALNVGADTALRQIGSLVDATDDFAVMHVEGDLGNETVAVLGKGLLTEDGHQPMAQSFTVGPNGRITGDGGDKDDTLALAPDVISPAVLHGGAGNDLVIGGGGADTLTGDVGLDALIGGGGNDSLSGGVDQDYLDGQEGDDTLSGGSEADVLIGGPGADVLDGGAGFDTASYITATVGVVVNRALNTGSNDAQDDTYISIERIIGSPFADILLGGAGSDNFAGGAGDDVIDGGGGDDLLTGDAGADQLTGGAGNDFASYTVSPAAVNVSLLTGQGSGGDAAGDTLSGIENLQGSTDFGDTLEGDNGANWIRGLNGNNVLRGLDGDDSLEGGLNSDSLEGGNGNDTLRAGQQPDPNPPPNLPPQIVVGNDTLLGGAGNDVLYGDAVGDLLDGGADADQIYGGPDNDTIFGGTGDDTVYAGAGNDSIDGGEGLNFLSGDDGNDFIIAGSGPDQLFGGAGNDTLNGGAGANALHGDTGDDVLISLEGNDSLYGGIGNDTATAGAGDDSVIGDDGNDSLDAGIGSDRVDGGNGNDFLSVGSLRSGTQDPNRLDHLFGGTGSDTITADFSNQTIPIAVVAGQTQSLVFSDGTEARDFENVHDFFTGSDNDNLRLDGAADDSFGNLLKTGAGNDSIYSGSGNDNVDAGDDNDFVNGGFNDAVLTYNVGLGSITGFSVPGDTLVGGAGNDTLSFEGFYKQAPDNIAPGVRFGVVINLATGQTGGAASGITISGFENIIGTNYGDDLTGDDGPNFFDPLRGGGTNGTNHSSGINGGPDQINGGAGDDTLRIDFSVADPANSLGIFTAGAGFSRNTIGNTDVIDSYSYSNIENLQITGASKDDLIWANFVNGNDTLIGLAGNDTLGGHGGSDVLVGGDGDDVLAAQASPGTGAPGYEGIAGGHDVFDGGLGNDLVEDVAFNIGNFSGFFLSAGALFQLDGGVGVDTLSADFSNESGAIVWNGAAPTNLEFADGAYARNFEQLRNFASGSGNDSITQLGRADNRFALGDGNDTVNPGIGLDTVFGGAGDDLLILDYTAGDGPTAFGVDSSSNGGDAGSFRRYDPTTGTFIDYLTFRDIERLLVTGSSHDDFLTGTNVGDDSLYGAGGNDSVYGRDGNDSLFGGDGADQLFGDNGNDTLAGDVGNDSLFGANGNDSLNGGDGADNLLGESGFDTLNGGNGNDTLDGGTFADSMKGGAGNDAYYVDNPADTVIELVGEGIDTVITSINYTLGQNLENLTIADFVAANGTGNNADNTLTGSQQDNLLTGLRGNDTLNGDGSANRGTGQRDTLTGGAGGDLFVLGTSSGRFYDDNNSGTDGQSDYALITDFTPSAGDRLQLFGSAGQYLLSPSP
ncbi:MAG: hypothetical protein ACXWG7_00995, partial [Chthoniobacterales bacterium]